MKDLENVAKRRELEETKEGSMSEPGSVYGRRKTYVQPARSETN
jgi:hypothetical protein